MAQHEIHPSLHLRHGAMHCLAPALSPYASKVCTSAHPNLRSEYKVPLASQREVDWHGPREAPIREQSFYECDAVGLAPRLLGKLLPNKRVWTRRAYLIGLSAAARRRNALPDTVFRLRKCFSGGVLLVWSQVLALVKDFHARSGAYRRISLQFLQFKEICHTRYELSYVMLAPRDLLEQVVLRFDSRDGSSPDAILVIGGKIELQLVFRNFSHFYSATIRFF
ncbi:hypothetical protein SELMODRAFT_416492 [Selaginella moellendorffii]|uniref:Uncharacterized protein n=1 Tax=Selaginella moellendorffii TaxID=88036 RepID=D8RZG1_SELML|nr:hypothetical protein SELMODRAFT_416492 [Selaginella moellendorffii]